MLHKAPASFAPMGRLIHCYRRAGTSAKSGEVRRSPPSHSGEVGLRRLAFPHIGRIEAAAPILKAAERSAARVAIEPGFRYCQGVHARCLNNPRAALRHLNQARRDGEWGAAALTEMISIYLNPENETNWDELDVDAPRAEPSDAVRAAERLLRELPASPRRQVLECYTLMAYKQRHQIDKAVAVLLELLQLEKDYLPALVCLSQAYLMLKQAPKARNHLKRVAKLQARLEMISPRSRSRRDL